MFTHLEKISTLVLNRTQRTTNQQSLQDIATQYLATVMKRGIDLHVHSPRTNLQAGSLPLCREHSPAAKPSGRQDTIAAVTKRGIDLHVHSPRTNLHTGSQPHRGHCPAAKPSGHHDTIATVMKRGIVLQVHSPRTNLQAGSLPLFKARQQSHQDVRTQ